MRRLFVNVLILAVVGVGYLLGALDSLEYAFMDLRFRLLDRAASGDIILVEIDGKSLQELDVWPWPRNYHAKVIDRLIDADARLVVLDIDFSSRSTPDADKNLAAALKRGEERVVLPAFKQHLGRRGISDKLIETFPLEEFARYARIGSVVLRPESDSRVRRVGAASRLRGKIVPSYPVLLAGYDRIPSYFYIDFGIDLATIPRISYVDVLRGNFDPHLVAGRSILIGTTAIELGDQLPVPLHEFIAGSELIALAAESIMQNRTILRTWPLVSLLVAALIALLLSPGFARWSWQRGLLVLALWWVVVAVTSLLVQRGLPISVDIAPLLLVSFLSYAQSLLSLIERQTRRLFSQRMAVLHRSEITRSVVENSFDAIVIANSDGKVTMTNSAAEALFGYKAAELVGGSVDDLFGGTPGKEPGLMRQMRRFLDGDIEVIAPDEGEGYRKDGSAFIMELSARKVLLRQSRHPLERRMVPRTYLVLTMRDISMRKQAEKAKWKALQEAMAASRSKSEFMAAMSHELRTPLNAIIGFSEMMKEEVLGPIGTEKYREYSIDIHRSGSHLLEIINDILDVTKVEAGKTEVNEESIDVHRHITSVMRLVNAHPGAADRSIGFEAPASLPALVADQRQLKQILLNLLSNALKFTPEQGRIEISASIADDGGMVIAVADSGIGIPADEIDKVVQRFYQVDRSLARKYEGTGLGLSLVNSFMSLHGGRLIIDSKVGRGTVVTCWFPPRRVDWSGVVQPAVFALKKPPDEGDLTKRRAVA